jgi:hypothetical protein
MKKLIWTFIVVGFCFVPYANADMFGGDVLVLTQILTETVAELAQLKSLLGTGEDTLGLMQDINRGINDSLNLMRTISPNTSPGIYKDWDQVSGALAKLGGIYGTPIESHDSRVQQDTDESVAEAVTMNNTIYKYTQSIDEIGELIKNESHTVSPGGAAKLTAQSLGVMLNLQNEMLRTQATGLKLQAQALAIQNRKDKERTRQMVGSADDLNAALANQNPQFALPRFE